MYVHSNSRTRVATSFTFLLILSTCSACFSTIACTPPPPTDSALESSPDSLRFPDSLYETSSFCTVSTAAAKTQRSRYEASGFPD